MHLPPKHNFIVQQLKLQQLINGQGVYTRVVKPNIFKRLINNWPKFYKLNFEYDFIVVKNNRCSPKL